MNTILMVGSTIVTLALIFYTLAFLRVIKHVKLSGKLLFYFSLGLFFDIVATCCMIIGSSNSPFTLHGFIGYSALLTMSVEVFLIWRLYAKSGLNTDIPAKVHTYTKFAYSWWVLAFITGAFIAIFN